MAQIRHEDRLSPPLEGTWPGEWDPARQDAEMAHNPLKTSFIDSFKKALLAENSIPNAVRYFETVARSPLDASSESEQSLTYPLMLFSRLPSVPPDYMIDSLHTEFLARFQPYTPILRSVPPNFFALGTSTQHLRYAVACLGSVLSDGLLEVAENLFVASTLLINGIIEVDNRIARTPEVVAVWVILEVYGMMSADPAIWRRTNSIHGFIETASRRIFADFKDPMAQELGKRQASTLSDEVNNLILSYFVMIDVFRAIHFGAPTSFSTQEFSIRLSPSLCELNAIFQMAVFDHGPLPADLSSDNALLLLTTILSEINTAITVFHPLEELAAVASGGQNAVQYHNPLLPFSLSNETSQVKGKLSRALDLWHQAYCEITNADMLILFNFCKLQLVFPNLQFLPILAGYPPRVGRNTVPIPVLWKRVRQNLKAGADALKYAWLIIESCNSGSEVTSVWLPIVIFHASLVVWSMIIMDGETRSRGSVKVLAIFKMELERMKWPCCRVMADVLGSLMRGEHTIYIGD